MKESNVDYETYQRNVLARASTAFHGDKVKARDLNEALSDFIYAGNQLDAVKKALMYGRDYNNVYNSDGDLGCDALVGELSPEEQGIIHAILGFATEGVELIEALFARFFMHQPFDATNLQEEFGDGEWYRALGLRWLGQTHEENITQNDRKLEARYGPIEQGFTYRSANERDLETERKTLEGRTIVQLSQCGGPDQLAGDCCANCYQPEGTAHAADCKTLEGGFPHDIGRGIAQPEE